MTSLIDQTTYNSPEDVFKNHINGYCPEITSDVHSKSLMEAISDHLSDDVLRAEFAVCMRCTCCKAHQSNRPAAIDSQFNTAKVEIPGETFPRCPCPCRYAARYLRRAYFIRHFDGVAPIGDEEMEVFYGLRPDSS